ncbi:MAG: hypothetical protein ACI38A_12110 [Candidatus Ornithomonoglobus sp.]
MKIKKIACIAAAAAVIMAVMGTSASAQTIFNSKTGVASYAYNAEADVTQTKATGKFDLGGGLTVYMPESTTREKDAMYPSNMIATFFSTNINGSANSATFTADTAPELSAFGSGYAEFVAPSDGTLVYVITSYMSSLIYKADGTVVAGSSNSNISVKKGDVLICYRNTATTSGDRGLTSLTFTPKIEQAVYTFEEKANSLNNKTVKVNYTDGNGTFTVEKALNSENFTEFSGESDIQLAIVISDLPVTTTVNSVVIE